MWLWRQIYRIFNPILNHGPIGFYRRNNGGDLAAMIAFNALFAFIPILLLIVALAGLLLKDEDRRQSAIDQIANLLPSDQTREAVDTLLRASDQSAQIGLIALIALLWTGTSFVTTVSRAMDRIYGVQGRNFFVNRLLAVVIIILVAILLVISTITATLPAVARNDWMPDGVERHIGASEWTQFITLGASLVASTLLFLLMNLSLPNAGQRFADVWPGSILSGMAFTLLTQSFPLYLQYSQNLNRYGAIFGVVWLLLAYFLFLAQIVVIGTMINAGFMRWRQHRKHGRDSAPIG
jgi:membrane protein